MFDLPSHVRLSEWVTLLVLVVASAGAAVRTSGAYPRELYGGLVALTLVANAVLIRAVFHNNSIRRQRALDPDLPREYRD